MHRRLLPLVACVLAAPVLAACGSTGGGATNTTGASDSAAPSSVKAPAPAAPKLPKGTPAALRANAADANTLAGEGTGALKARLVKLAGHPVVVNQWGSWCPPCRAEFPYFATAVARHAGRVAFVGIDTFDARDAAQQFLDEQPPGFASVFDPDGRATRSLGGGRGSPTTFFIAADGRTVYTKIGGYASAAALEADIARYAGV